MGQKLNFPHSLKKLTLSGNVFNWEECRTKIGLLPFLEYLKLDWSDWTEWETVEGQFRSLKFLHLLRCRGLRIWKTDNTHFPCLEHLFLEYLVTLEEIPSSVGHIPTLKSIKLDCCSKSAADSARSINEEQIELGNEDLEFIIITEEDKRRRRREKRRRMEILCPGRDRLTASGNSTFNKKNILLPWRSQSLWSTQTLKGIHETSCNSYSFSRSEPGC